MADSLRYKDWYAMAAEDFKAAKILFEYKANYGLVAFHCQQAIEKGLKGFILRHTGELTEGHSLTYLCKKAKGIDASFEEFAKDCAYVNQFYIETRYPADIVMELDESETTECLEIAERFLQEIRKEN